jgi:PleD family two-component response regulator
MSQEKILVVEDDASVRKILTLQLTKEGYAVHTAEDGLDGLEKATTDPPDLVLLDLMMPKMDGAEVCRRLKGNFLTSQIPVIMLTACGEMDDKITGLNIGANDYLTKPYMPGELIVRVRNILHFSRLQRQASPLTGLPGNVSIDAETARRLESQEPFALLYVDIDNFKAYNDYYSFEKGDEAIKLTSSIILRAVGRFGGKDDFVGHVGGDDFVVFSTPENGRQIAEEIVRDFDVRIPGLYNDEDRARGFIEVVNRQNEITRYPMMSITVAGVTNVDRKITHIGQLSGLAAEVKRLGKRSQGSVAVWDRRND